MVFIAIDLEGKGGYTALWNSLEESQGLIKVDFHIYHLKGEQRKVYKNYVLISESGGSSPFFLIRTSMVVMKISIPQTCLPKFHPVPSKNAKTFLSSQFHRLFERQYAIAWPIKRRQTCDIIQTCLSYSRDLKINVTFLSHVYMHPCGQPSVWAFKEKRLKPTKQV